MLDADPELKAMMEESIALAAVHNPDRRTNPAQSLEAYYNFLDWSATCMPWNILDAESPSLYARIDQSLNYFYYLLDQPLPELAGKGYYYPCLEYHEPIASWTKEYCRNWVEFLSTLESWNDEHYATVLADEDFHMNKGWYADPYFSRCKRLPQISLPGGRNGPGGQENRRIECGGRHYLLGCRTEKVYSVG